MRLDLPAAVERLQAEGQVDLANVSASLALYTDTDVLFLGGGGGGSSHGSWSGGSGSGSADSEAGGGGSEAAAAGQPAAEQLSGSSGGGGGGGGSRDLSTCTVPAPQLMMLGREKARGAPWDAGVLLVNIPELRRRLPGLLDYGEASGFDFPGHEQGGKGVGWGCAPPACDLGG